MRALPAALRACETRCSRQGEKLGAHLKRCQTRTAGIVGARSAPPGGRPVRPPNPPPPAATDGERRLRAASFGPGCPARLQSTNPPCGRGRVAAQALAPIPRRTSRSQKPLERWVDRSTMTREKCLRAESFKMRAEVRIPQRRGAEPPTTKACARPAAAAVLAPGALGAPQVKEGLVRERRRSLPSIAPSAVLTRGGGALPWGTAGLISTRRPSMVWMPATTESAVAASLKVTKPKPRDTPVVLLRMTAASVTSPNRPKYSLIASSSVAHVMPPRNNLPSRPS